MLWGILRQGVGSCCCAAGESALAERCRVQEVAVIDSVVSWCAGLWLSRLGRAAGSGSIWQRQWPGAVRRQRLVRPAGAHRRGQAQCRLHQPPPGRAPGQPSQSLVIWLSRRTLLVAHCRVQLLRSLFWTHSHANFCCGGGTGMGALSPSR